MRARLTYSVTEREVAALRRRLRLSRKEPGLAADAVEAGPVSARSDDFAPALSRRAIRNAALAWTAEHAMEDLPGLLFRRKTYAVVADRR